MSAPQRPPRTVALVNGGVAVLILAVVAAFGVAVSPTPPPSIAAFPPDRQQHAHQKSLAGQQNGSGLGASTPTGIPNGSRPPPSPPTRRAGATPSPHPPPRRPPP